MSVYPTWPGWKTVSIIGSGASGTVYEIQRDMFGNVEKAALKVISIPQSPSEIESLRDDGYDDESITSRYRSNLQDIVREYSLMSGLKGVSNIVDCDDVQYIPHEDGFGWDVLIKMELLTPIAKALSTEVDEETVIQIGIDICRALVLCKDKGIVHRDIKPQNVFVSSHGNYKLGDFGVAKVIESTTMGTKTGTYRYMAPEVYNNLPYGAAADVYSLGLLMYWMLNKKRTPFLPMPPQTPTARQEEQALVMRCRGDRFAPPCNGSDRLKDIVLKACEYDPGNRYNSAKAMMEDLEALRNEKRQTVEPAEEQKDQEEMLSDQESGNSAKKNEAFNSGEHGEEIEGTIGILSVRNSRQGVISDLESAPVLKPGVEGSTSENRTTGGTEEKKNIEENEYIPEGLYGTTEEQNVDQGVDLEAQHGENVSTENLEEVPSMQEDSDNSLPDENGKLPENQSKTIEGETTEGGGQENEIKKAQPKQSRKPSFGMIGILVGAVCLVVLGFVVLGQGRSTGFPVEPSEQQAAYADESWCTEQEFTNSYGETYSYTGEVSNGKPNGYGTGIFGGSGVGDPRTYTGTWVDGNVEGSGTTEFENGGTYTGDMKGNKRNGKGQFYYTNGDSYDGNWKDDHRNGQGTFIWADGSKYVGEWLNDQQNGQGTEYRADGSVSYVGTWKDGNPVSSGVQTVEDLKFTNVLDQIYTYTGEVRNGLPNGYGTGVFDSSNLTGAGTYVGTWKDGSEDGYGTFEFDNGDSYEGEIKQSVREGRGTYTWSDGNYYDGEWLNDNPNGQGKMVYSDGVYEGQWEDGLRSGHGKGTDYNTGDAFEGEWVNDSPTGVGTFTSGTFDNGFGYGYKGEYKNSQPDGQGKMIYSNGDIYEGEWQGGKRNGQGKMTYSDGWVYSGEWRDGWLYDGTLNIPYDGTYIVTNGEVDW